MLEGRKAIGRYVRSPTIFPSFYFLGSSWRLCSANMTSEPKKEETGHPTLKSGEGSFQGSE